ncbi:MAG: hypothetical protein JJ975_04055 [Bacteroidia bacterium]|nr:hypothetical protein [Bacteroidia bacterium]
MIFNDVRIGNESPPLEYFGSSCVWHDTAYHYMHNQRLLLRPWNTTELKRLLSFGGVNFFTVIHDLVSCKSGEIHHLDVEHDRCIIHDLDNQTKLVVPVPGQDSSKEFDESVEEFMYLHGFDHYLGIDFSGMSF